MPRFVALVCIKLSQTAFRVNIAALGLSVGGAAEWLST